MSSQVLRPSSALSLPQAASSKAASAWDEMKIRSRNFSSWRVIGTYALCSGLFAFIHGIVGSYLGASNFAPFSPTRRYILHLNENLVFLVLGNFLVGGVLAVKDLVQHRFVVGFAASIVSFYLIQVFHHSLTAHGIQTTRPHIIFDRATRKMQVITPLRLASTTAVTYSLLYFSLRKIFWRFLLRQPVIGVMLKSVCPSYLQ